MEFKIKNLNIFYKNSPDTPNYVYEKTETTYKNDKNPESVKELGKIDKNVNNINSLLNRLNAWKDNSEMVCNVLNQAIKKDAWAKFMIVENNWKKEIWLVIDKSQENAKTILSTINDSIKKENNDEYFFDENKNNKKDVWELSVDKNWNITGVDIEKSEKRSYADVDKKFNGKYYRDWDKFVYEVWKVWDKWAAILRQVVALWDELWIDTTNYEKIKEDIGNLYVYKEWKNVIFSKDKPKNVDDAKQVKNLEITVKWKTVKWIDALNYKVHTWDKIDISSLATWLGSKKFKAKLDHTVVIKKENTATNKETVDNKERAWWTFYTSWGIEYWDVPDDKKITYTKANWDTINTDGKNLQINAKNMFDTENKGKNNNKFSKSIEIWKWKNKSYLVVWENVSGKSSIDFDSIKPGNYKQKLKELKNSWLEAWLASYDKNWNMIIKEVWDSKVQEFIRRNNFSDAWKSVNNPIYLETTSNDYTFQREIDWKESNITFSKGWISDILKNKKSWESITLKSWDDKLNKEQWNNDLKSIFGNKKENIDNLFKPVDWKPLFMEFKNLHKNKDGTLEDVILKFTKTEKWVKITKVSQDKENNLIFNVGNNKNIENNKLVLPDGEKNEILQRSEIIKSIDFDKIETRKINNLWYPSFSVSKNTDGNVVFTKNWEDGSKDNYSFKVKWFDLNTKNDLINFFNKDYLNIIFAASSPGNIKYKKKWWKKTYCIEKSNIVNNVETNKNYVKDNLKLTENKPWDQLIQKAIQEAKNNSNNQESV